jgi:uncharacterized protein
MTTPTPTLNLETILSDLIKNFVDKPESIQINTEEGENTVSLNIISDPSDAGKIIGKGGKTIDSLRQIARVIGYRLDKRVILHVVD